MRYFCLILFTFLFTALAGADEQQSPPAIPDPAAYYAEKLGYKYQLGDDGQAVVIFPDGSSCGAGDFLNGKACQKWTCCEQHSGKLERRTEDMGGWTTEYSVCLFAGGYECSEYDYANGACAPGDYKKWSPDPAKRIKADHSASDQQ